MKPPLLTPARADKVLDAAQPPARILWTAEAIARRLGCSADFVRGALAEAPGSPIRKIGGRWCAEENALIGFMRNQP